jgi:AcrR family transcriptional regulator
MSVKPSTSSRRHRAPRGQGEALRGEILAAAKELLAETGNQEAVSVRAVAERVGISTPSIYLHFKDKEELLEAVCAEVFVGLAEALRQAGAQAEGPLAKLVAQGRAYVEFALARPEHYRLATMVFGQPNPIDTTLNDDSFMQVIQTVTECMDAGIFPRQDPIAVGLQLWSAVHGIASLIICKPWLPWGDVNGTVDQALRVAATGCALAGPVAAGELSGERFAAQLGLLAELGQLTAVKRSVS